MEDIIDLLDDFVKKFQVNINFTSKIYIENVVIENMKYINKMAVYRMKKMKRNVLTINDVLYSIKLFGCNQKKFTETPCISKQVDVPLNNFRYNVEEIQLCFYDIISDTDTNYRANTTHLFFEDYCKYSENLKESNDLNNINVNMKVIKFKTYLKQDLSIDLYIDQLYDKAIICESNSKMMLFFSSLLNNYFNLLSSTQIDKIIEICIKLLEKPLFNQFICQNSGQIHILVKIFESSYSLSFDRLYIAKIFLNECYLKFNNVHSFDHQIILTKLRLILLIMQKTINIENITEYHSCYEFFILVSLEFFSKTDIFTNQTLPTSKDFVEFCHELLFEIKSKLCYFFNSKKSKCYFRVTKIIMYRIVNLICKYLDVFDFNEIQQLMI